MLLPSAQRSHSIADSGAVPFAQGSIQSEFHPDRHHHAGFSDDRLAAATHRWLVHRQTPSTLFSGAGHGFHARRAVAAVSSARLRGHSFCGRPDRHRLGHLPPGGLARCAHGFRWPLWHRSGLLSSRRQCRAGGRAFAGGIYRPAARPGRHCLGLAGGTLGYVFIGPHWQLVPRFFASGPAWRTRKLHDASFVPRPGVFPGQRPDAAAVFKERLQRQPDFFLHFLPDRTFQSACPGSADPVVYFHGLDRSGHLARRCPGRPYRAQAHDFDFDPGCPALHAGLTVCRPVLDRGAHDGHRLADGFSLSCHFGLRP